jgi:hypothetical protein
MKSKKMSALTLLMACALLVSLPACQKGKSSAKAKPVAAKKKVSSSCNSTKSKCVKKAKSSCKPCKKGKKKTVKKAASQPMTKKVGGENSEDDDAWWEF